MPEAATLEDKHQAFRVTRVKAKKTIYRLAWYPEPSDSPESPARITVSDMLRLAFLRYLDGSACNDIQRERLIGLGLLSESA